MQKKVTTLFLTLAFLLSLNILWSQSINLEEKYFTRISAVDAHKIIEENKDNPDIIILDVRTPDEFNNGHIEKAINIDYNSYDFQSQLKNLDKDKTYLVYCRSGSRSTKALEIMKNLDFKKVINIGGIIDWTSEGYSIVK